MTFLAGPELIWLAAYGLAALLVRRNQPSTEAGSRRLEKSGYGVCALAALLSFAPWFWMPHAKGWLLLRVLLAGAVGALLVSLKIVGGINYQDSRNSGLVAALFLYLMAGYAVLAVGLAVGLVALFLARG